MYFHSNSLQFVLSQQQTNVDSDIGLAPNRLQTIIIWTDVC